MSSILVPGLGTKILRCTMQPEIEEEKQGGGENFPAGFALFKNIYIYIFNFMYLFIWLQQVFVMTCKNWLWHGGLVARQHVGS